MGGPAGVPEPERAAGRRSQGGGVEAADLADGLAEMEGAGVIDHGDAGAVVAAVLQALQSFVDDGPGVILPDVSYYAAHSSFLH